MGSPTGLPIASLSLDHPEEAGRPCPKAKEKAEIKKSRLPFFLHHESFSDFQFYNRFNLSCQIFFRLFCHSSSPSSSPQGERRWVALYSGGKSLPKQNLTSPVPSLVRRGLRGGVPP
jgi:hypothetical protein